MIHSEDDQIRQINFCIDQSSQQNFNQLLQSSQPPQILFQSQGQNQNDQFLLNSQKLSLQSFYFPLNKERLQRRQYLNIRRNKKQKQILKALMKKAQRFSHVPPNSKRKLQNTQNIRHITKNLLVFAKSSHFSFISQRLGVQAIQQMAWLNRIRYKKGINLQDYDMIYKCPYLKNVLKQFFDRKVLYRQLMLSRSNQINRIIYLYFLDIFQENFNRNQFRGISETKMRLQTYKLQRKL